MAIDRSKIAALAAAAAQTGPDLNKQSGGDYKPPEKGATRLRFIEYVELGVHTTGAGGQYGPKTKPRAQFGFELSGPRHLPKEIDGKKYPHIIRFDLAVGQGKKNDYSKLFKLMVADFPGRKNFAQLLGEAFLGTVVHREYKKRNGEDGVSADLKNGDAGFTIKSTTYEDVESGVAKTAKVDEALSELRLFLWDFADSEQWDSIFIDGTYDDGNTKNKLQEKLKAAENFVGSPIYLALQDEGRDAELEPAPVHARGEQQDRQDVPVNSDDDAPVVKPGAKKIVKPEPAVDPLDVAEEEDPPFDPGPDPEPEVEVDEEAELLAQMAALKAKKAAAAKAAVKAPASPVAAAKKKVEPTPAKPAAKASTARKSAPADDGSDPLQGL